MAASYGLQLKKQFFFNFKYFDQFSIFLISALVELTGNQCTTFLILLGEVDETTKNEQFTFFIELSRIYLLMELSCFTNILKENWRNHINDFIEHIKKGTQTVPMMYPCRQAINIFFQNLKKL